MRWRPAHDAHAIERVSLNFELAELLPTKPWQSLLNEGTELFPKLGLRTTIEEAGSTRFVFPGGPLGTPFIMSPDLTPDSDAPTMGRVFRHMVAGRVHEEVSLYRNRISYSTSTYGRWQGFRERARELLASLLDQALPLENLSTIRLEYWDRFVFEGSLDEVDYKQLLRQDSRYVPSFPFSTNENWHSHVGYFSPDREAFKRLININIDMIDVTEPSQPGAPATMQVQRRSAGIYSMAQDRIEFWRLAGGFRRSGLKYGGVAHYLKGCDFRGSNRQVAGTDLFKGWKQIMTPADLSDVPPGLTVDVRTPFQSEWWHGQGGVPQNVGSSYRSVRSWSGGGSSLKLTENIGHSRIGWTISIAENACSWAFSQPFRGDRSVYLPYARSGGLWREKQICGLAAEALGRSYLGSPSWDFVFVSKLGVHGNTAVSENAPLLVTSEGPADPLIDEIVDFRKLQEGWDGEDAAKPSSAAIRDAVRFIRAAGVFASRLEPTLHVDGSIILEIGDGVEGSFRFKGDHRIVYAAARIGFGSVRFDGSTIPDAIRPMLCG